MNVVGGDECGIVDVDGVIDDRMLLLTREQAGRQIDQQETDRNDSKRAVMSVAGPIKNAASTAGSAFGVSIDLSRGQTVALPCSHVIGRLAGL